MKRSARHRWIWPALLCLGLILAPRFLDEFQRYLLTEILMWGLFALGFDIIFGKVGLLNFGMSSFFGLGSYGFVMAFKQLGGSVWLGLHPAKERVDAVREVLGIPEEVVPFAIVPIGYSNEIKGSVDRYQIDRVHYDRW